MTHVSATFDQLAFRFREDDGNETGATWLAAENVDPTNFDVTTDHHLRLRIGIQETAGGSTNNVDFTLQYQINGGTWLDVNGSTVGVVYVTSSFVANQTATTDQLTTPTGTFQGGAFISASGSEARISFSGNDHGENEYSLNLLAADLSDGDVINFRLLRDLAVMDNYSQVPTVTVTQSTPAVIRDMSGTASGTSTASANASNIQGIDGTASGTSIANGTITNLQIISGSASGTSVASGNADITTAGTIYELNGTATGTSIASGNLDITPSGTIYDLSGTAIGTSIASAVASPPRPTGITVTVDGTTLTYDNYEVVV